MSRLEGKIAIITGGARGTGEQTARLFAAEGAKVVAADIEQPPLDEVVAEIAETGGEAIGVVCDVSDWESVDALRARTDEAFGPADIVMNNAGVAGGGAISSIELRAMRKALRRIQPDSQQQSPVAA